MKKKILVTGAGGFIGSHLTEILVKRGYNVVGLVPYNIDNNWGWIERFDKHIKDNLEVLPGDITDASFVNKNLKKVDVVFNLAALISIPYSYKSPLSYINTNIIGTHNLLEASKNNGVSLFVQTSTSEVYGSAQFIPITEKHPLNAQSPYAATKISSDQLSLSYYRSFGLPVTVIRPFNTFGPRQSLRASIPTIISQIMNDKKKIKLGNVKARRDFTYVTDTAEGFIKTISNKKAVGEVINLGTGKDFSIKETVNFISNICNTKIVIESDKKRLRPKKSEVNRLLSSNKKAKEILGWDPFYKNKKGFIEGLRKTIEWFSRKENTKIYKPNIYNL
tara:strand:- start:570 stop:1571 length:1002 start_codon:yes stop_codon:yes gene_type:complete